MNVPDAAIEAAMSAWEAADADENGPYWLEDMWRTALDAAMPAIREALAQEIEAAYDRPDLDLLAARIVRGGTP